MVSGQKTLLKIDNVEKALGIPAEKWRGKCHQIASLLLTKGLTTGKLRYGHWLGPVHPNSTFFSRVGAPIHHGWVERSDGTVVDPTRFEFEQVPPYIYVGSNDFYDAGGNAFRYATMRPPPAWDPTVDPSKLIILKDNSAKLSVFVKGQLDCRSTRDAIVVQLMQAFWLANLPLQVLGDSAKAVYTALIEAGQGAFIPMDNKQIVMEES